RGLLAVALVALGACAPASASPSVPTVAIGIHYSAFSLDTIGVEPGEPVGFVVTNSDPIDHEFIIGDRAVQTAHELGTEAFHPPRPGEITIPAGDTVSTTFTFGERDLLFGCHLPGHYVYGMRGTIEVASTLPGLGGSASARYHRAAGWSSPVARWAHNPEVTGSNPVPATTEGSSSVGRQVPYRRERSP